MSDDYHMWLAYGFTGVRANWAIVICHLDLSICQCILSICLDVSIYLFAVNVG